MITIMQVAMTCALWGAAFVFAAVIWSNFSDRPAIIVVGTIGFGLLAVAAISALISTTAVIWTKGIGQ